MVFVLGPAEGKGWCPLAAVLEEPGLAGDSPLLLSADLKAVVRLTLTVEIAAAL
jgi:hypothetical protein